MTLKEKLNSILRLRLFCSTEEELSRMIGYQLHANHFNNFTPFQCEAYYSQFVVSCLDYTNDTVDLTQLLEDYKYTSEFYDKYILGIDGLTDVHSIELFISLSYLGDFIDIDSENIKHKDIFKIFISKDKQRKLNIGILVLMIKRIIPTFKNKYKQNIDNILADFECVYNLLIEIVDQNDNEAMLQKNALIFLKELELLIEDERKGDKFLNRLLLIYITNDIILRIVNNCCPLFSDRIKKLSPLNVNPKSYWRDKGSAENEVWKIESLSYEGLYALYHYLIDFSAKKIHFTKYQLYFNQIKQLGKTVAFTQIFQPSYMYLSVLHRNIPKDALTNDYSELQYEKGTQSLVKLCFSQQNPLGEGPFELDAVNRKDYLDFYMSYIEKNEKKFTFINDQEEYNLECNDLPVYVSELYVLLKIEDKVYRLDKYDEDGCETIKGISNLTHKDNYVLVSLKDDGVDKLFIGLDTINVFFEYEDWKNFQYVKEITEVKNLFH